MRHFGVKVSIVEPGFFRTAVTDLGGIEAALRGLWERLAPETRLSYGEDFFHKCERGADNGMGRGAPPCTGAHQSARDPGERTGPRGAHGTCLGLTLTPSPSQIFPPPQT